MQRRSLFAVLAALPFAPWCAAVTGRPAIWASELFGDPAAARAIGRHYLARHPHEASPARLLAALEEAGGAPAVQRARLAALRRRDFAEEDMVCIGGWLLARSEARLCALAAVT